jgi:hypothetical protein
MKKKPILVLDFDGVIHSYSSGWKGASIIPDAPVPGSIDFILSALKKYEVAILSSRSHQWGGKRAMKRWLKHHLSDWLNRNFKEFPERDHYHDFLDQDEQQQAWKDWHEFMNLSEFNPCMDPWDIEVEYWTDSIIKKIKWPWFKPAAVMTIDDRAITFKGTWPMLEEIAAFKPWNKA